MNKFALAIMCLIGFACGPAMAGGHPLDGYFSPDGGSCYRRVYTRGHLAAHPGQTVAAISFSHFPGVWGPTGKKAAGSGRNRDVYFVISAKFRNSPGTFKEIGMCSPRKKFLRCQIDCDGGEFELHAYKDGRLLLKLNSYGFRLVAGAGGCGGGAGDGSARFITRNTDDKAFLLSRLPDDECIAPKRVE